MAVKRTSKKSRREQATVMPAPQVSNRLRRLVLGLIMVIILVLTVMYVVNSSATTQTPQEHQMGSSWWWDTFTSPYYYWYPRQPIVKRTRGPTTTTIAPATTTTTTTTTTVAPKESWASFFASFFTNRPQSPTTSGTTRMPWPNCLPTDFSDTPAPTTRFQVWSQVSCSWVDQNKQYGGPLSSDWMYTDRPFSAATAQEIIDNKKKAETDTYQ